MYLNLDALTRVLQDTTLVNQVEENRQILLK